MKSKELWSNLMALAILCQQNETDNCDLTIPVGKLNDKPINVHIEFSMVEDGE